MTDDDIRADLEKLKAIVADHKAPQAPLAVATALIDGRETPVFSKVPANLGELYQLGLAQADNPFLVYQQERYSFAQTLDMARRLARVLREQYGIGKGDRVAICARNSPEWCIAYMGITLLGAVVVPMNSWWQGPELEYGLKDSDSRLVFVDQRRLALLEPLLPQLGVAVVAIKPGPDTSHPEFYELISNTEPLDQATITVQNVLPEDNVSIMYTSGSTGMPKGVLSSHRAIINALYTWLFVKEITEILRPELVEENPPYQPAILCNVPLFHVTGSHAQFLASFVYLRKFVMMYKWDADEALRLIEAERISVLHGVPTMTWEVMQSPRFNSTDLGSLRSVAAGGAPRPPG
ncbi:MAG: AMP-binding protein, partial [Gammaproteobacteria bacterium]